MAYIHQLYTANYWLNIATMFKSILLFVAPYALLIVLFYLAVLLCRHLYGKKKTDQVFLELTFPADNNKSAYATEQLHILLHTRSKGRGFLERALKYKKTYSLELVSISSEGIRYIIVIPAKEKDVMQRSLLSYMPGIKVKQIDDYLPAVVPSEDDKSVSLVELKLSADFVLPLQDQKTLNEYDPMTYLTGHMTKLSPDELIAFQIVATPILPSVHRSVRKRIAQLKGRIYYNLNLSGSLDNKTDYAKAVSAPFFKILATLFKLIISLPSLVFDPNSKAIPIFQHDESSRLQDSANPYEQELGADIKNKISQHLFETSIRILIIAKTDEEAELRSGELITAFRPLASSYQSLTVRNQIPFISSLKKRYVQFQNRRLSPNIFGPNPILSSSEITDLYHFPHIMTTRTEDLIKSKSQDLPVPLSLKNNQDLDVVFGLNNYGNRSTEIGLSDDERSRHMYLIGQTGSGKSTAIYHMAKGDINKGRGLAVVDPHGDLAEDLLATVPIAKANDLIYFNPFDIKHPVGINLLELEEGLEGDELELEKELVCESVVSIFRRIFNKDETVDAHRIEYILRNTIHTAFAVENATIFTVYELLNNPKFQKRIVSVLGDKNLKQFWKNEFGKAGNYQVVKMVSGVTAKIGRLLFSPTAKRILEQPKSTVNFDDILDNKKILLCNLAEGNLGEDTSQLLGTIIIAKIHQAALRRARKESFKRTPFYLFVDEFQNFATSSFTKLLSGGRKFGLRIVIAEQSTAQQADRSIINVVLANTGVVVCFRTASPIDEDLMLSQFAPLVKEGDIANLPRHHFYMRLAAIEAEDTFSGETIPIDQNKNIGKINKLVEASRNNYAIEHSENVTNLVSKTTKKGKESTTTDISEIESLVQ